LINKPKMGEKSSKSENRRILKFSGLMGSRRSRQRSAVTAVEVAVNVLKVVQASRRGGSPSITRSVSVELDLKEEENSDPQALGGAIAASLFALKIKPGPVVMSVPRDRVILKTINVPLVTNERELASIVRFQIARDLPFPISDAVVDFRVTGRIARAFAANREGNGKGAPEEADEDDSPVERLEVLVAIVKRDCIDFFRQTAEAAKLNLVGLGWSGYANFRCLQACGYSDDDAVALVSLNPDSVNVDVVAYETILFSHSAAIRPPNDPASEPAAELEPVKRDPEIEPSAEIVDPAAFAQCAALEVVRSLHAYGGVEQGAPVTKAVIAGTTGCEWTVVDLVGEGLDLPCVFLDPAAALGLPHGMRKDAADSVSTIGLALGACLPGGLSYNFLDPKKPAVHRDLGRIKMVAGIVAGVAIFLTLFGVRSSLLKKREAVHAALRQELADEKSKQKIYRAGRLQAKTVREWTAGRGLWLDHFAHLSAILPSSEEIYLTSFTVGRSGSIRMGVQARSGEIVARLDATLRESGYEVKPIAITPGSDRHGYPFRSSVEVLIPAKMEFDLAAVAPPARPADDGSLDALKGGGQ
jgi:Tfp pilus assembly PilM family ATPase